MAEKPKFKPKPAAPKPSPDPIGFIIILIIVAGVLMRTSWGKSFLLGTDTATSTATTTKVVNYQIGQ